MRLSYFFSLLRDFKKDLTFSTGSNLKIFNFWPLLKPQDLWFSQFMSNRNVIPYKKTVSIYSVFGDRFKMNFDLFRPKIFFTGENPLNRPNYKDHCLNDVQLSLGFDYLQHPKFMRFPLWYLYFIKPTSSIVNIQKWIDDIETISKNQLNTPRKFCSLVSAHDPMGYRKRVLDIVQELGIVESGGALLNNTCDLVEKFRNDKVQFLKQFKYNIALENSDRQGYVTEKIFHALVAGCVPIYWGSGLSPEPDILNHERILFYDPNNPQVLKSKLTILKDEKLFMEFSSQPVFKPGSARIIYDRLDELEFRIRNLFN